MIARQRSLLSASSALRRPKRVLQNFPVPVTPFRSMIADSERVWQNFNLVRPLYGRGPSDSASRKLGSFGSFIRLTSPYPSLCARYSCQVPKVLIKGDSERISTNSFGIVHSNKRWKKARGVAACADGIRINSSCTFSSLGTSNNQFLENDKAVLSTEPSSTLNRKGKQSRRKKKKEQASTAVISEEAVAKECSTDPSPKNVSDTSKKKQQSNMSSKKTSTSDTPVKVIDSPSPKKRQSIKKNQNSGRKGKSFEETNGVPQKVNPLDIVELQVEKQLYPPSGKSVVVVESVTKSKVIQGYLGDMFEVLPSYGHVRDLAARSGSVRPNDDFSMVWEVPNSAWTHLKSIKVALSGAKNLILATDPDREGEAIAWHIVEMLLQQDVLQENISLARVVFHEITESSIKNALRMPRQIDVNLVHAYLARRALDYLIGFNISPLLWRKLPGCQSAGRVQSAALSLICDRETEIDEFEPQEFWSIHANMSKSKLHSPPNSGSFSAQLTHHDSKKLTQLSISSHAEAREIEKMISLSKFQVIGSKRITTRRNPPTPYITSTLQQDAANKLNFPASYTMRLAQKLYEGIQLTNGEASGLITYVRTDGLHLSDEAVVGIRSLVVQRYGADFVSDSPRKYFKKVKNSQEAHEAIRPTDVWRFPSMLVEVLDEDSLKLYTLIWSRALSCQMEPAKLEQIQVDIGNGDGSIVFRSSCSRVEFLGYQAVYQDAETYAIRSTQSEENDVDETFETLRSLRVGDIFYHGEVEVKQHQTQAPARYSEGSLVNKMEDLGIGRPSTYASTLKVLQDRNYVTVKKRVLYPEFRGRMVSAFLSNYFSEVMDYSFTADMENELDNVSAGLTEWKGLLGDYWTRFSSYCTRAGSIHIHQVEKMLEKTFGSFLFASLPDKSKTCPSCMEGTLIFKVSRFGSGYFIGCNQHPRCKYIAKTLYGDDEDEEESPNKNNSVEEPKLLGLNTGSNEKVLLKCGPYGYYVQLGEDRKGYSPKRASVSHIKNVESVTLQDALELLRYPLTLGIHPKDGHPVMLKLAKDGFSVRHRRTIASVPKKMKPTDVTLEIALELLSSKDVRRSGRPKGTKNAEAYEA